MLYAGAFRLLTINRPFEYDDEATGCFYGIMARNYLRFPWARTLGMPVLTAGTAAQKQLVFYRDHPPLVPLAIAPVYAVAGVGAWQTRLPTSAATVAAVIVLYLLLKRAATPRSAILGAALFAAAPMNLYFGGMPEVVGMPLVPFALLTVMAYLEFHRAPRATAFALLAAAFALAAASDWPAFVLVPVLVAHFAVTRPRRDWPWMAAFGGVACLLFAVLYVYITVATDSPWDWMVPIFKWRSAIGVKAPFTMPGWLRTALIFNISRHTAPLMLAAGVWTVTTGLAIRRAPPGATVARILLAWGVLFALIGRQGVYNHEWWWWPLSPGLATAAALFVDDVVGVAERVRLGIDARLAAGTVVAAFMLWTAVVSWRELYPRGQSDFFTTTELGSAIRAAAPEPDDLALLVWEGEDPQLWFYGDRPLKSDVWSIADFERRQRDRYSDLAFRYLQPSSTPGAGLVFPTAYRLSLRPLHEYLSARYPRIALPPDLARWFDVFDLRHPI